MTIEQQSDRNAAPSGAADIQARLMLLVICLIWGTTWPAMKIALNEMPPLSMRTLTAAFGGVGLLLICLVQRRSLRVRRKDWANVFAAAVLNIVGFSLFSAFAQMSAATTRVAILNYMMPVWTLVLAWAVLGDRPTRMQSIAIALCAVGVVILVFPAARAGVPLGLLFAVASGFSWASGTVYLKWARLDIDPLALATWQVIIALVIITTAMLIFDGRLEVERADAAAWFGVIFSGVAGNAIAYALWFNIVGRVSALTATLGIVGIPVLGVVSTMVIIGERLTTPDIVGFALIFAASVCAQIPTSVFQRITGRAAAPIR